ncbi:EAL domain-containing protein [Modestobacter sp. NPDC049651]|uniref:putative bifunctional diguanylate cyclase/phosphodiesterase n=1 Tax=unclassified Modestobacter TaxID=2643866 RepID=UPI00340EFA31
MEQRRRYAAAGWLPAAPALTGAAGGTSPLAADLLLLLAAVLTAGVLWRRGRRVCRGLRGWTLLAVAVVVGVLSHALAQWLWPGPSGVLLAPARLLVPLPALLLALAGVLTLPSGAALRRAGGRLLTGTALFGSATVVLGQVLVVGPALHGDGSPPVSRLALELSCGATAVLLTAVLVVVTVSAGPRRTSGALLLAAAGAEATAHGLAVVGAQRDVPGLAVLVPAAQLAALLLLSLAARRDPGRAAVTRRTGPGLAGQLLPHLVMAAAVLLYAGAALLGAAPTGVAALAASAAVVLTAVHRVLSARHEARVATRLRSSEAYFRSLVRASTDAVLILDPDLTVTWAPPSLAGGPALTGAPLPDAVHPDDAAAVRDWLTGAAPTGLRTFRLPGGTGSWRVLEAGVTDLRDDADVRALVLHCRDVTARLHREGELRSLAFTDPLTGLPNRAAQTAALTARLAQPAPAAGGGLLVLELCGLREAQADAGRDVGEVALTEVARRLRATVRGDDQVARVGTELFGVLAEGADDELDRLAARCLSAIEQPLVTELGLLDLTAVVGLVPLTAGLTAADAVDRAELAVADARTAGPGAVRRWRLELGAARDRREALRRDLVGARERGELSVVWQPVVALADSRVTGVEALLRWQHPTLGEVLPEEFLPVAEQAGLVLDLQRWVFAETTRDALTLPEVEGPLTLAVNVSVRHLAAGTLVGDVGAALRASGLPAQRLQIEITESALLTEGAAADAVAADVAALRLMGVRVALDDLGRGWAALPQLARVPVDVVKLDPGFLARIDRDAVVRALCESVVRLADGLGMDVVAEGIESTSQLAAVQAAGCTAAQGFLLARPLPLPALRTLLVDNAGLLWPGLAGRVGAR